MLKDPGRFTVPCTMCEVKIPHALWNLGDNLNLISLALVKNLKLGEPKHTNMTLTLIDLSITHPYGVIKNVLVKMDGLVFLIDFMILGRPFLATGKSLIDVELGELRLKFNNKTIVLILVNGHNILKTMMNVIKLQVQT